MDNQTYQQLIGQVGTIITIVSPLVYAIYKLSGTKINNYFQAKINTIDNADLRTLAQSTLELVDSLITKEVTNADVTLKPAILQAISNGKMSTDDLSTLKTTVKENVLSQLTEDSKTALNRTIANVDTYLNSSVETILANLKLDETSPVSKTILPEVVTPVIDTTELENKLSQVQADKDTLAQQVDKITSDKSITEQANQELVNQNQVLIQQISDLNSKLTQVQSVLQPTV